MYFVDEFITGRTGKGEIVIKNVIKPLARGNYPGDG